MFRSLALSLAVAEATKLLVVDNSNVVGGPNTTLVEIDLEAQSTRAITDQLPSIYDFVRNSLACGNTWYCIGSALPMNYLAVVDMTSGEFKMWPLQGLYYDLKCGDSEDELLAVTAEGNPPVFSLTKVTLQQSDISAYPVTQQIGQFPEGLLWGGWTSIFHFSDTELQATFPRKGGMMDQDVKSGEVVRMDIKTGEITMHKNIHGTPGVPLYIKHLGGDSTSTGLFAKAELEGEPRFCQVDFTGKDIKVSNCGKRDERFWNGGNAPVQCGSDPLFHFPSVGAQDDKAHMPILSADMETGELTTAYAIDFGEDHYVGTHTCAPSASSVVV